MTRQVIVRRLAERHLSDAYAWYEAQCAGLGVDFLDQFAVTLQSIAAFPEANPVVFMDFRRALLRRFPFGAFYLVDANLIVVSAVYHLARDPRTIRSGLKE